MKNDFLQYVLIVLNSFKDEKLSEETIKDIMRILKDIREVEKALIP